MPTGIYDRSKSKWKPWNKGIKGYSTSLKGKPFSKKHKKRLSEAMEGRVPWDKGIKRFDIRGEKHPRWKGGRSRSKGYIYLLKPKHPFCNSLGYISEHRLVIEVQIGRYLLFGESCHHLNEIKDDNRPENLMGFISESAHQRFHHNPDNVKPEEIIFDGRFFKTD